MNKNDILSLAKKAISKTRNTGDITHLMVYFQDVDHDGIDEMITRYSHNLEDYSTVLKYMNDEWVIFNTNSIKLYPAYIHAVGGKKWGYINESGKFMIKPRFSEAKAFHNERAIIKYDDLYGVIDETGNFIVLPTYLMIYPFHENRAIVMDDKGYSVIDENGSILTEKPYAFISSYNNERALCKEKIDNHLLSGYLDLNGEVVIPIQYEEASDFHQEKAVVKKNNYQLINLNGDCINIYQYPYVGNYSDFRLVFNDNTHCGYLNELGDVMVKPLYEYCQAFKDNLAIVTYMGENADKYGLIDLAGNTIIKPIYNDIKALGDKRYALGKAKNMKQPYIGSYYAIADDLGKLLTDFIYDFVNPYENHLASVTKKDKTFFIDLKGQFAQSLPVVAGKGMLKYLGKIIQAHIDSELYYIDDEGKIINYPNYMIPINDGVDVVINKYKPNKNYLVYYPQIEKVPIQYEVNDALKALSLVKPVPMQSQYEYYGDFTVIYVLNLLLEIEIDGYKYPFGAAHGFPYRQYVHLNYNTGVFYTLNDLFKDECDYLLLIAKWVKEHTTKKTAPFIDENFMIKEEPLFYVDMNQLYIIFKPYEIAPYSDGFRTIKIPFDKIIDCIDINSDFWQSFH